MELQDKERCAVLCSETLGGGGMLGISELRKNMANWGSIGERKSQGLGCHRIPPS